MGFEKGNQYWKLRAKHGRNRIITDPILLSENIDEYFQWCIDNPIIEIDYRGKDLSKIELPRPRAFKKEELARYVGMSEWRLLEDLRSVSSDFSRIIKETENIIADQKYTYAIVGMFNPLIVSRDLGLKDHSEVHTKDITPKSEQELMGELEKLQKKIR